MVFVNVRFSQTLCDKLINPLSGVDRASGQVPVHHDGGRQPLLRLRLRRGGW